MSQRALLLRTVQRFLAPPIEVALSRKAPANSPVVSSDVMEKGKKVSDEEVKEKMEHEAKRAVEETRGEQAAIDQKAERWVQDPFREGKRKEEERERNEQTEQEESQRAQGESQSGPLEKEDEQCKAKVEQAVSRAMEADADDLVTEMPIGYNNEFESDEDVSI